MEKKFIHIDITYDSDAETNTICRTTQGLTNIEIAGHLQSFIHDILQESRYGVEQDVKAITSTRKYGGTCRRYTTTFEDVDETEVEESDSKDPIAEIMCKLDGADCFLRGRCTDNKSPLNEYDIDILKDIADTCDQAAKLIRGHLGGPEIS